MERNTLVLVLISILFINGCRLSGMEMRGIGVGTELVGTVIKSMGLSPDKGIGRLLDTREKAQARDAAEEALSGQDGTEVSWKSMKNEGVMGSAELMGDGYQKDGISCKTVRELVVYQGQEESGITEFCLIDNSWQITQPDVS